MTRIKKRNYRISFFPAAFLLAIAIFYLATAYPDNSKNREVVFVSNKTNTSSILETLQSKGLIKNQLTYYAVMAFSKLYGDIKPGGYNLTSNMSAVALYKNLKDPDYKYVAIAEGLRREEIAEEYGQVLDWSKEKIETFKNKNNACLFAGREGYMFPGTYLVKKDASIQSIQETMENKFDETISELEKDSSIIFDRDQIVIIASLIQREAFGEKDMGIVSGIIWNRIFEDMPLQIDATLQYIKAEDGHWWPQVYSEDKFIESPFNTYQQKGLPPEPIANPGKEAIYAALNPVKTDCLFYIHDRNKNIHCSSDYDSHLANIKRYLK